MLGLLKILWEGSNLKFEEKLIIIIIILAILGFTFFWGVNVGREQVNPCVEYGEAEYDFNDQTGESYPTYPCIRRKYPIE